MKKQILVLVLVAFSISLIFNSSLLAECRNGNTAITIVNPAGKAIETCVPEVAITGIQEGTENSGGTVVSAICPCFTQEDLEDAADFYGVSCGRVLLQFDSTGDVAGFISNVVMGDGSIFFKTRLNNGGLVSGQAYHITGVPICPADYLQFGASCTSESVGGQISISTEEASACQALLWATFDWLVKIP